MALTRSQIERLGGRLVAADEPADDDLALLHELLLGYDIALRSTLVRVNTHVGILPTARIKNTGTILEKLRRHGGSWLKSIQDIAGMRIVQPPTADEQDAMVRRLVSLFADERRQPRVIDRRARPKHGYTPSTSSSTPEGSRSRSRSEPPGSTCGRSNSRSSPTSSAEASDMESRPTTGGVELNGNVRRQRSERCTTSNTPHA